MIIMTSLSPGHSNKDNQHNAVKSWQEYGDCFSMNSIDEIISLQPVFDNVDFIKTDRTVTQLIGKPLISINAMIDFANKYWQDLLLINSDIILTGLPELRKDGVTIFSRYDYTNSFDDAKMFIYGFDVFHIPHHLLSIFPPSVYSLGCAWFDLSIPYRCILNKIPVYYPEGRYAYHKIHPTQYNMEEWNYISEYFKWEFKLDKRLSGGQVATMIMNKIKSNLK
jgi:hypothetical protein